ncbi:hypothetical protein BOTNAR_0234g00090 [Botryotinia narcissicola]|uniref:Uncharacterized protein n=1 Tax=Botryotinia narcissicola TaxID=278944 RepID=A0A4Z1I2N0_9HELO|nr:hypothetical protein BOTNAR_0234g00090 [Botryotinia narcissicola]
MSSSMDKKFESVDRFVSRYNECKNSWEYSVSLGKQEYLGITKENFRKLDGLKIPKGVNKKSLIKPSEDWFEEQPGFRKEWESKMKSLRRGEEIIEAKALSDAFMNDPVGILFFNHLTTNNSFHTFKPTLESGPSQPVLPPSRAQQSVQPSLNTAGFLLAKPNPNPDLQGHSKLSDDPINPTTYSWVPSQTPGNSNPSSTTPGTITRPAHGHDSSTGGWINRYP